MLGISALVVGQRLPSIQQLVNRDTESGMTAYHIGRRRAVEDHLHDRRAGRLVSGVLGETWIETGEAPDWQRLYDRREGWQIGTVPAHALFLTAGADVQKDRIEVSIWAWGRGLESWLVEHLVIDGGPKRVESWDHLSELLDRTWPHAHGARLGLAKVAIDTGYETPAVYAWARRAGHAQVVPVKGVEGFNRVALRWRPRAARL